MSATAVLNREIFSISREMEYFSERELTTQCGYALPLWWPRMLTKEMVDNGLDECELAGVRPRIKITVGDNVIEVRDNGRGMPDELIDKIKDFSSRTSDKASYISPTRGSQGNAWKTILAAPYVLNGETSGVVEMESCGLKHRLTTSKDQVRRRPHIEHFREKVKTEGTLVRVFRETSGSQRPGPDEQFLLKQLIKRYSFFNPHARFELNTKEGRSQFHSREDVDLQKWMPRDPTPPDWYSITSFEELIGSYVGGEKNAERPNGSTPRTVRDFLKEFRGLSGSAVRTEVLAKARLERAYLHDFATADGKFHTDELQRLLDAMKEIARPVKPRALGVLGKEYFRREIRDRFDDADNPAFTYLMETGEDATLPFVVEFGFGPTEDSDLLRGLSVGINFSVPLDNPFKHLESLLWEHRINIKRDPVSAILHVVYPRFSFLDRGKGTVSLSTDGPLYSAIKRVITDGTKRWAKIKKQEERDYLAAERAKERFQKGQKETVFITDVIGEIIPGAYADAAGKSGMAQCRQIYYSARGPVFQMTGKELDYPRFRNKLLPEFMRDNKKLCADWDVIFEGRGHFIEPHTDYRFEIGTLGVRQYLQDIKTGEHGPRHLYDAILYIEKEGFLPILKHDGILERYDMAVMSSKGQNSTSLRELVDSLNGKVKILAVHDFDIAGFSIVGTLTLDTERWHHQSDVKVIDLGLRLEDIDGLQTETVDLKGSDPTGRLEKNGATEEEIEFLCSGRRVELNAFPSDDFIAWLDRKLNKHKVKKIIPDDKTLGGVYRAVIADQRLQDVIKAEKKRIYEEVRKIDIPRNLGKRVAKRLKIHPAQRWNVALAIEASENSKQDRQ